MGEGTKEGFTKSLTSFGNALAFFRDRFSTRFESGCGRLGCRLYRGRGSPLLHHAGRNAQADS